jgi:retron-type reverse transcriptase
VWIKLHALKNERFSKPERGNGVAMGSPLSPVIANYFMEYFEEMALELECCFPVADSCF